MSPNSFDAPSVLRLPKSADGVVDFVREHLNSPDGLPDVLILDIGQGTAVIHRERTSSPELSAESLPFLLSNHTLNMLKSEPTFHGCLKSLTEVKDTKLTCLFVNPDTEISADIPAEVFKSSIITDNALLGYYEGSDGVKSLTIITIGASDEEEV